MKRDDRTWDLGTDESFETIREKYYANQRIIASWFILWACMMGLTIPFLLWKISISNLPPAIRPFWNVYFITPVLSFPLFLLLYWTKPAKESRSFKGLGTAINCYDIAQRAYGNWKMDKKIKDLKKCHDYLKIAEEYLDEVPKFKRFKNEIDLVFQEYFEG